MPIRRPLLPIIALVAGVGLTGCVEQAPPPSRPAVSIPQHHAVVQRAITPPDWFHRQLALARHARATHLPAIDSNGAQRAYFAVMLPVCSKVAANGPVKYQARCKAIVDRATTDAANANAGPPCDDEHDDSADTPAQITACSD